MSRHIDQVESVLVRAVQKVLSRGINDPRVRGMISVTRVKASTDLANATVFVSVMPAEHGRLALHGLRHAARYIRRELAEEVQMRRVPALSFKLDPSIKNEAEIICAINRARPQGGTAGPIDDDSLLEDSET